jgi:branched-chain amino acid transport system ATP-binding protein
MRDDGPSALLIEQNAPLSLSIADRAYILDDGKVVYSGRAADLAKDTETVNQIAGAGSRHAHSVQASGAVSHGANVKSPSA